MDFFESYQCKLGDQRTLQLPGGITPLIQFVQLKLLTSFTQRYDLIFVWVNGMNAGLVVPNPIALAWFTNDS